MPPPELSKRVTSIQGVNLTGSSSTWDINIEYDSGSPHGTISSITPHESSSHDKAQAPLALPALTHPHIHLDKAYVHNAPNYGHLLPCTGTFSEALSFTTKAKQNFTYPDVLKRGEWLLAESVSSGVTAMRAFVEVDHTVQLTCLDAAVTLKDQWKEACHIQIACFAQDPVFSSEHGEENRRLIEGALGDYEQIDVLGTTPYVESSAEASKQNIEWAIESALKFHKHVDFHLDYNLDPAKEPLIWHVLHVLRERCWTSRSTQKRVMLGHCTRLTLLSEEEWQEISRLIHENDLPVSFVGLPTSDLYMAAPVGETSPHQKARGTLRVPDMIRNHELDATIGINNVGNAFTPWGSADPLFLACVGVGVYQAGAQDNASLLYECVSTRARAAIGLSSDASSPTLRVGGDSDFILFHDRDDTGCGVSRPRTSVAEVVWDPPQRTSRSVVANGRVQTVNMGDDSMYKFE
ncbi:hypothetical protein N7456_007801 [Penicillium angulare]|uniref:Zinc metallopeptidase n=1 Tax=Penicillium angulare TaxID=116970 RepID=A0A9W9K8Q8_9EURO|nr:hypothetical protein N7456_007801 [Penicillium angulare]